jgi:hypothetical protein
VIVASASPLPWRRLLAYAAVGTLLALVRVVPSNVHSPRGIVNVIKPGAHSGAAPAFAHDFPGMPLLDDPGHDGGFFYVVARDGLHLRAAGPVLDRPRYRAQRILFPVLAWLLHPSGGGRGLVVAMFLVGVAALFAGGVVLGSLSVTLRGPPWLALVFPLLPGSLFSLNLSVPDALALVLALAAVTFDLRRHGGAALVAAVAAGLTRESVLLVLLGYALWRRDRIGARLIGVPAAVVAVWWLALRLVYPRPEPRVTEFDPVHGLWAAARYWAHGGDQFALVALLLALVAGCYALQRGAWRRPLGWAIVLQLAFLPLLSSSVLALTENGTRTTLPLLAMALVGIVSGRVPENDRELGSLVPQSSTTSSADQSTSGLSRRARNSV